MSNISENYYECVFGVKGLIYYTEFFHKDKKQTLQETALGICYKECKSAVLFTNELLVDKYRKALSY